MAQCDQGRSDLVLHVPAALRDRVEEMASRESVSLNLFVLTAIAEKLQRLQLEYSLNTRESEQSGSAANRSISLLIH